MSLFPKGLTVSSCGWKAASFLALKRTRTYERRMWNEDKEFL